jgi:hypothetical protein
MSLARKLASILNSVGRVAQSRIEAGPAFSAYLGATQTVSNGVATKLSINTEIFDSTNAFDTTNFRFQPTVAGYYVVVGRGQGAAATSGTIMNVHIYKNGALLQTGQPYIPPSGSSSMTATISGVVYLNGTTDYIELWGTNSGSGTNTFSAGAGVTYFQATLATPS